MSIRRLVPVLGVVAALGVGACGGSSGTADRASDGGGDGSTVVLKDIAFKPAMISVARGTTVTWKFEDGGIPHNVTATDDSFSSETKDSGTFTHTFDKAGTVTYTCTIHPNMKGTVEVA